MLISICILILVYSILGKDVTPLLERVKNIDWHASINALMDGLRVWTLKVGRTAARPLLQFYYVMSDEDTSTIDCILIYAAILYTISPASLLPAAVYRFFGVLDEGAAILYVYKKVRNMITPEINSKVDDTLNAWFGVEYEWIEG